MPIIDEKRMTQVILFLLLVYKIIYKKSARYKPSAPGFMLSNQQPQPQSLLPQLLPQPPQSKRMMIRIMIQEEPPQPKLLHPQPIIATSFPVSKPSYEAEKKVLQRIRILSSIFFYKLYNASVDSNYLPCDICAFGKKQYRPGNLLRRSESAHGNL